MSALVSALPESGHGWTIYEYTSWLSYSGLVRSEPGWTTRRPIAWSAVGGRRSVAPRPETQTGKLRSVGAAPFYGAREGL